MTRLCAAAPAIALLLGGCAVQQADRGPSDAADLAEALAGRTAGPARRCIGPNTAGAPTIVGENLLFRDGRRLFVSAATGGCPSLRGDPIVVIEAYGSDICENDRFRTVERGGIGIPGPYCRFGPFVPWTASK